MNCTTKWTIFCRPEVFDKCRSREGFSELVCLGRCINALTFLYSAVCDLKGDEPSRIRDRMNFYFFNAAVLYEGLSLVKRMNSVFKTDAAFQKSMRPLLKDKAAQKIESLHLKNVRHNAVNHFFADAFSEVITKLPTETCVFLRATGTVNKDVHFEFADRMTVRILVGDPEQEDFRTRLDTVLVEVGEFNSHFVTQATEFLVAKLYEWGFEREESQQEPVMDIKDKQEFEKQAAKLVDTDVHYADANKGGLSTFCGKQIPPAKTSPYAKDVTCVKCKGEEAWRALPN